MTADKQAGGLVKKHSRILLPVRWVFIITLMIPLAAVAIVSICVIGAYCLAARKNPFDYVSVQK